MQTSVPRAADASKQAERGMTMPEPPGYGPEDFVRDKGWRNSFTQVLLMLLVGVVFFGIQKWREASIWAELRSIDAGLDRVKDGKDFIIKTSNELKRQEAQTAKLWKTIGHEMLSVQEVRQNFNKMRTKNVDFQDHLTKVLKELSAGVHELRVKALPSKGETEESYERTRFPALWSVVTRLEERLAHSDGTTATVTELRGQLSTLKHKINDAKAEINMMTHTDDLQRYERLNSLKSQLNSMDRGDSFDSYHDHEHVASDMVGHRHHTSTDEDSMEHEADGPWSGRSLHGVDSGSDSESESEDSPPTPPPTRPSMVEHEASRQARTNPEAPFLRAASFLDQQQERPSDEDESEAEHEDEGEEKLASSLAEAESISVLHAAEKAVASKLIASNEETADHNGSTVVSSGVVSNFLAGAAS